MRIKPKYRLVIYSILLTQLLPLHADNICTHLTQWITAQKLKMAEWSTERLFDAARTGDTYLLNSLVACGTNINVRKNNETPLLIAVKKEKLYFAFKLLNHNPEITAQDKSTIGPLIIGNTPIEKTLRKRINIKTPNE